MAKIDIRALKLNKRYVPKTITLNEQEGHIALGYFDIVQVEGRNTNIEDGSPFLMGYKEISGWKIKEKCNLVDHSSQEQVLFTNIHEKKAEDGTGFSEQTIEEFWTDENSPYLFLAMLHINHIGNMEKALKRIKAVFQEDYLSYVSFDYCDIVVFAKNISIRNFLLNIKYMGKYDL